MQRWNAISNSLSLEDAAAIILEAGFVELPLRNSGAPNRAAERRFEHDDGTVLRVFAARDDTTHVYAYQEAGFKLAIEPKAFRDLKKKGK